MSSQPEKTVIARIRTIVFNLFLISAGSLICAVAINGILVPKQFVAGGLTGLALIIHYLFPSFTVGWIYFVLNIPLFVLGWVNVGRRFFLYSVAGMLIFSVAIDMIHIPIEIHDNMLSALFAGIISGIGGGLIFRSLGSAGGTDILSIFLLKRFSISIGTTMLGFNCIILLLAGFLFSIEMALYALVFIFVTSKIVNLVVTGFSQRKAVLIISVKWEQISETIMNTLFRGVTIIKGEGGYTKKGVTILYTVIAFQELARLKRTIRGIDPDAFVVVTDTLEVMGVRIGNQPHW